MDEKERKRRIEERRAMRRQEKRDANLRLAKGIGAIFLGPLVIPIAGGVLEGIIEANGIPTSGIADAALAFGPSSLYGAWMGLFCGGVMAASHNSGQTSATFGAVGAVGGFGVSQGVRYAAKYATMGIYKAISGG